MYICNMKIISKNGQKDFYDYLIGIYGEDPKIVLDRRDSKNYNTTSKGIKRLYFCGIVYDIYFDGKQFYYLDDLKKFDSTNFKYKLKYKRWGFLDNKNSNYVHIKDEYSNRATLYHTVPYFDDKNLNEINNCPIIIVDYTQGYGPNSSLFKYPNLGYLNFKSVMSASDTFIAINNWLSNQIDKTLEVKDNLTDLEKIQNKGFDKKSSFRPKIKNSNDKI